MAGTFISCSDSAQNQGGAAFPFSKNSPVELRTLLASGSDTGLFGREIAVTGVRDEQLGIHPADSLLLYYYGANLKQVMQIKAGRREGVHVEFQENGELYFTGTIHHGKSDGIFRSYDADGKLMELSVLVDGRTIHRFIGEQLDSLLRSDR